jgi:hypothetical protein
MELIPDCEIVRLLTESAPLRKLVHFIALWRGEYSLTLEFAEKYLEFEMRYPPSSTDVSRRRSYMIGRVAPDNMRWLPAELVKLRTAEERKLAWVLVGFGDDRFPQLQAELLAAFPAQVPRPISLWCDDENVGGFSDGDTCMSVYQELEARFGRKIERLMYIPSGAIVPFSPDAFEFAREVSVKFLDV